MDPTRPHEPDNQPVSQPTIPATSTQTYETQTSHTPPNQSTATTSTAGQADPGNTMAIVGFILAFFVSIVGLILSVIAFRKSKKAGVNNNLALAGIIVGSTITALWTIFLSIVVVIAIASLNMVIEQCSERGTNFVYVEGKHYDCPDMFKEKSSNINSTTDNMMSIANTPVEIKGSKVESTCFTFDMPANYILSPEATTCQAELRMDNESSSGIALTAIFVKAQIGESTPDSYVDKMKDLGADEVKIISLNGAKVGFGIIKDSLGIEQTSYFIPDTTKKFAASNGVITSYFIYGPAGSEMTKAALQTVVDSFVVRKS